MRSKTYPSPLTYKGVSRSKAPPPTLGSAGQVSSTYPWAGAPSAGGARARARSDFEGYGTEGSPSARPYMVSTPIGGNHGRLEV
jgi:hypothetical protein